MVRCADLCKRSIMNQATIAQWGIGHHWHAVLSAPGQQIVLDRTVGEAVAHLISRTAMAVRNAEKIVHVADFEVGHSPGANFTPSAQALKPSYSL